jgi:hypothetical protein
MATTVSYLLALDKLYEMQRTNHKGTICRAEKDEECLARMRTRLAEALGQVSPSREKRGREAQELTKDATEELEQDLRYLTQKCARTSLEGTPSNKPKLPAPQRAYPQTPRILALPIIARNPPRNNSWKGSIHKKGFSRTPST